MQGQRKKKNTHRSFLANNWASTDKLTRTTTSWYVFCLLVILVKLSVLAQLLARKTHLRKPNCGEWIVSIKPRLKSAYDFLHSVYCFIVL